MEFWDRVPFLIYDLRFTIYDLRFTIYDLRFQGVRELMKFTAMRRSYNDPVSWK